MKTLPVALAAHIATRETKLATALKVTRPDGQIFGFTTHDVDAVISGVTYRANPGLDITDIVYTANLAVGNLELTTLNDGTVFTPAEVLGGVWRNSAFTIFRYNWDSLADGIDTLLVGKIGELEIRQNTLVAELRDLRQQLQQPVGSASSRNCRYRLGSTDKNNGGLCMKDVSGSPWTVTGTITSVSSNQEFRDNSRDEGYDFFGEGQFTFTSGNCSGLTEKIKKYRADGRFFLARAMFSEVQVGDSYIAVAGCRKRLFEDCRCKFDNVLNFGGEPHRKGVNSLTGAPDTATIALPSRDCAAPIDPEGDPADDEPGGDFALTVSADVSDYNVYDAFVSAFGDPPANITLQVSVSPGVTINSTNPSTAAMTWGGSWPGTPIFTLVNEGEILGMGGAGGAPATVSGVNGAPGEQGGNALELNGQTVSITNASGHIFAGGGGGGGGGGIKWTAFGDLVPVFYASSNGFTGATSGGGGQSGGIAPALNSAQFAGVDVNDNDEFAGFFSNLTYTYTGFAAGNNGTAVGPGSGGTTGGTNGTAQYIYQTPTPDAVGKVVPGVGGAGGAWAASGSAGSSASFNEAGGTYTDAFSGTAIGAGGAGGAPGKAINLSGGAANFVSGSGAPNVMGDVS